MSKSKTHKPLPPIDPRSELVNVIIETPKLSAYKYSYDHEYGLFRVARNLPAGCFFPYDFGFIPGTRGEDGDPLDVLVMLDQPTVPGCFIHIELIGVLEAMQKEKDGRVVRNDRLIGQMRIDGKRLGLSDIRDCGRVLQAEIEQFFISYNQFAGKKFKPLGWHGPKRAQALLAAGIAAPKPR